MKGRVFVKKRVKESRSLDKNFFIKNKGRIYKKSRGRPGFSTSKDIFIFIRRGEGKVNGLLLGKGPKREQ